MPRISFVEGLEVYYNQMYGVVRFVCEQYITVCVRKFPDEPRRDVCLVVYPAQYKDIVLTKESEK